MVVHVVVGAVSLQIPDNNNKFRKKNRNEKKKNTLKHANVPRVVDNVSIMLMTIQGK